MAIRAGRVACIFTPFVLTLASLACLVVLILGGSYERNSTLDNLYFAKIDLTNLTLSGTVNTLTGSSSTSALDGALQNAKQALNLTDYYTIYLRGYCAWNGDDTYAFCSKPTSFSPFVFDPIKLWGLNDTSYSIDELLPKELQDGLAAYTKGSTAMYWLFIIALIVDAIAVVVGITALFSRWGSLFTTIFADVATLLTIGGAIVATVMFPILAAALNKELKTNYGVDTTVGSRSLALAWIAAAFAIGAGFFWTLSICCCSGRSPYKAMREDRRTRAEKTPYTYERVGSPYLGPRNDQSVPLSNLGPASHSGYYNGPSGPRQTAYEPFRQQV